VRWQKMRTPPLTHPAPRRQAAKQRTNNILHGATAAICILRMPLRSHFKEQM